MSAKRSSDPLTRDRATDGRGVTPGGGGGFLFGSEDPLLDDSLALAARFEVSTRTVQRDLQALTEAGVPVRTTPGRGGGWSIDPAMTLPPIRFTAEEASARRHRRRQHRTRLIKRQLYGRAGLPLLRHRICCGDLTLRSRRKRVSDDTVRTRTERLGKVASPN